MVLVDNKKSGYDNIIALLKNTFPVLARICNPDNITFTAALADVPDETHNMVLTVEGASEKVTGTTTLPYLAFSLADCDCPPEVAGEMYTLAEVKAFSLTLPVADDELTITKNTDTEYFIDAKPGALTCYGRMVLTLAPAV